MENIASRCAGKPVGRVSVTTSQTREKNSTCIITGRSFRVNPCFEKCKLIKMKQKKYVRNTALSHCRIQRMPGVETNYNGKLINKRLQSIRST